MKNRSLLIALIAMVATTVTALANNEPTKTGLAVVQVKDGAVFKVIYKGNYTGRVKISLYNESRELVFRETFHDTDGFIFPLNFTGLPFGVYTIEVIDAEGKKVETFAYRPQRNVKFVHASRLANEQGKILLAIINNGEEKINVRILDAFQNILFDESKVINGNFAQIYKVAQTGGAYSIEVSDSIGKLQSFRF